MNARIKPHDIFGAAVAVAAPFAAAATHAVACIADTMSNTRNIQLAPCIPNSAICLPARLACNNPRYSIKPRP